MKRLRTGCDIPFNPADVWAVVADFGSYSEWNPLNVWADGDARLGARVRMRFVDAGARKPRIIAQTVTITGCDPGHYLEWVGSVPLLFRGRHFFRLERTVAGTRLEHGEDLSGLLPALWPARRIARQKAAYEGFNVALEHRIRDLA